MMNILDTFDPYAFVAPKNESDVLAVLDECIAELGYLNSLMDGVYARCEGWDI